MRACKAADLTSISRFLHFLKDTSPDYRVPVKKLTSKPGVAEGIRLGQALKACQTNSLAADDGRRRPELRRLNPQSDRGGCKENLVRGTYG